jgi:glycosyltransferase involved in cell wall biosynthesis
MKTLGRFFLDRFDAYHVLNDSDKNTFHTWGLNPVYNIPIGVDTNRFKPCPNLETADFNILFVGRLTQQKGIEVLRQAITLVKNEPQSVGKKIKFTIVGSGPLEHLVNRMVLENDNVDFFNAVTDDELLSIYQQSNLFVMPSRRETFGITALEAQSCGIPVVASNITGPSNIVVNGFSGTLIQKESAIALAQAISSYYQLWKGNRLQYINFRENARHNAVNRFNLEVIAEKIARMLKEVIANHNTKTSG